MQSVSLDLGAATHQISVELGLRHKLHDVLEPWHKGQQCVVISQAAIVEHYASVIDGLKSNGWNIEVITIPNDESAKSLAIAESVWSRMIDLGCDRSSLVLALGGGVVGDLSGFVAATFMRGIGYIQIPTTLLAMVDSSIGGKTAVNLPAGKNLVGAIYQPKAVVIDPEFLLTLPRRNVISSLAEAIKYGLIRDSSIFETFEHRFDELLDMQNSGLLSDVIFKSCSIKAAIVSNDQYEHGERRLLNFGHTLGHAFETLLSYSGIYHGEAVLYGMRCAAAISQFKGLLDLESYQRIRSVLSKFELPELPDLDPEAILHAVGHDKKMINGQLNFILIDRIGNGVVRTDVSSDDLIRALDSLHG